MTPSPYQYAIYDAFQSTKKNINISAVAGSGKTTTLLELLKLVPIGTSCGFFAFNKSIVEELKKRTERKDVEITTLHSFGCRLILSRYGRVKINPNKSLEKTQIVINNLHATKRKRGYYFYTIPKMMDLMRCNLCKNEKADIMDLTEHYDVDVNEEDVDIIIKAFDLMQKDRKQIDFADMIYIPITDPTIRFKKYDYVFCDESQDFSASQHLFIKNCIKSEGRVVTVGDKNQAIYGFSGADASSYDRLAHINGESITMPLSVSYRCAKNIIKEAQKLVEEIKYSDAAENGKVSYGSLMDVKQGDWILCRNLKPLVQIYMWLIKNKIKTAIRGKDIAEGILRLVDKTQAKSVENLFGCLRSEKERLFESLKKRGISNPNLHPRMELLNQKVEVIIFLCENVKNVKELTILIEKIFSDNVEGVVLSTIHKSKGLETERVFLALPELIPSKYAQQEWQLIQEKNLKYVAITRAKKEFVYVPRETFEQDIKSEMNGRNK